MHYEGPERRKSVDHQRGYQKEDWEDTKAYGLIVLGGIIFMAIVYTGLHYAGVA